MFIDYRGVVEFDSLASLRVSKHLTGGTGMNIELDEVVVKDVTDDALERAACARLVGMPEFSQGVCTWGRSFC